MKVLIDENLSKALARSLAALFAGKHEIVHLRDRFAPRTADLTWIDILSREGGWVTISGDRRISRNKTEYVAFRNSGLIGFFLCRSVYEKSVPKQMIRLLSVWDEIEAQVRLVQGGALFEIAERSSRFRQL